MVGVLAGSRFGSSVSGAANLLEIFIVHAIPEIIAHLLSLIQINGIVVAELLGPVHRLHSPRISISGIGVAPLGGRHAALFGEQAHEAFIRFTECFVVLGWMRDCFPHGFLLAPLKSIYIGSSMGRIEQVTKSVPVVHVHQPMHQVGLIVAVSRLQLGIKRVLPCRILAA
ncbi:hypothetical protein D3C75_383820 [compost metagenome]